MVLVIADQVDSDTFHIKVLVFWVNIAQTMTTKECGEVMWLKALKGPCVHALGTSLRVDGTCDLLQINRIRRW